MKVGVIASDLAGANEAAAAFRQNGLSAAVPLEWTEAGALPQVDVVALDTDTTHRGDEAGRVKTQAAALCFNWETGDDGPDSLFLYTGTLMQGPVGAALNSLLALYPRRQAIVAVAFPDDGVTVDMGQILVNGRPLDDERGTALVSDLICSACVYRNGPLGLGLVRGGATAFQAALDDLASRDVRIVIVDSQADNDLEAVAHVTLQHPERYILAGSAGLARVLVHHLLPHGEGAAPVLLVNGSQNPQARLQTDYLTFHWKIQTVTLNPDWVVHGGTSARLSEVARCLQEVQESLTSGHDTVLTIGPLTIEANDAPDQAADLVGDTLGEIVAAVLSVQKIRQFGLSGLVLSGGHTARQICRKLEATTVLPHGEVLPGMSAARLGDGPYANTPLVIKPGGTGPDGSLAECARYLKRGLK